MRVLGLVDIVAISFLKKINKVNKQKSYKKFLRNWWQPRQRAPHPVAGPEQAIFFAVF
jgi:hypothetical protein